MAYKFNITRGNAILNFSEEFCQSRCQLIESESFAKVLEKYIKHIKRTDTTIYEYLHAVEADDVDLLKDLRDVFKLLLVMSVEEVCAMRSQLKAYFKDRDMFIALVEDVYLFWRRLQRYAIVFNETKRAGYQNVQFADAQSEFEELVLEVYRSIQSAVGKKDKVLRQITAGVNAGLAVTHMRPFLPYEYRNLDEIPFIESVVIHPPFIAYSKRNKRDGVFPEIKTNPIEDKKFDAESWLCYPAKVGDLLCFVYFNVKFMAQGVTLCNLFDLADETEYRNRKPDLIYVYGYEDGEMNQAFYQDESNDMIVALLSANDDFDYFGYMKKMCLTLHNVQKINHRELPVHGAMVKMTLRSGETKNIVVMGDSGAGKSETIEQIKVLGEAYITDLKTIYDDMGVLTLGDKGKVKTSGTEIGAFVRLDDLDAGYSFKELDRSVFMNPDKVNARIVIPITDYKDVVAKHDVDLFLYANNYDEDGEALSFFDTPEEALEVFRAGNRMAKGTTTEYGLVGSYFANPFGPVQRREQTEPILQDYFKRMFKQGVKVGQLRTRLGIKGNEHKGPKDAAMAILKYVTGDETLKELPKEE
ncbi:phosphoenolpyruvate carboxykinase [Massilimicrobiota timonensis]|uniref:phosphoenolpyruvate carboxykinase n=1 Tax=Massilimicrobiota timonensis TaxID=1776392 RepID=UPI0019604850|nr:phosphoenolpyruvate carboxykinase [Massilimicrobiota timonensis]MBM6965861.1 phosphoenolpyruvate carboxykinase [Massilimicrobiota timonensis]